METNCVSHDEAGRGRCLIIQAAEHRLIAMCEEILASQAIAAHELPELLRSVADWYELSDEADHIETIEDMDFFETPILERGRW